MPRSTALALAAAVVMVAVAVVLRASWDGDGEAAPAPTPAVETTAPVEEPATTSTTEGSEVTFVPPGLSTTTIATGPPPPVGSTGLPLPGAEEISVGAGSSYRTTFNVSSPSPDDVVEWLLEGLETGGWDVAGVGPADGAWVVVRFQGPRAKGEATVTDLGGDEVGVSVLLTPPTE